MNRREMARAYHTIAEGFSMLAVACENDVAGQEALSPAAPASALAPLRPPATASPAAAADNEGARLAIARMAATPRAVDTGGLCPSHGAEFRHGQSGQYCPAKSAEPAWANRKGYCTITPETAGEWIRIHSQPAP